MAAWGTNQHLRPRPWEPVGPGVHAPGRDRGSGFGGGGPPSGMAQWADRHRITGGSVRLCPLNRGAALSGLTNDDPAGFPANLRHPAAPAPSL